MYSLHSWIMPRNVSKNVFNDSKELSTVIAWLPSLSLDQTLYSEDNLYG